MEIRKCGVLAFCLMVLLGATACSAGRDISPTYPKRVRHCSSFREGGETDGNENAD